MNLISPFLRVAPQTCLHHVWRINLPDTSAGGPTPSIPVGRLQCELETPRGLRIPSVEPHRAGSRQGDDGQDGSCSSSSNMASATLVAPPARHADTTKTEESSTTLLIDPTDAQYIHLDVPSSSSGRISYLQQRYQAERIPRNATQLLI